jgi:hypothetical protein
MTILAFCFCGILSFWMGYEYCKKKNKPLNEFLIINSYLDSKYRCYDCDRCQFKAIKPNNDKINPSCNINNCKLNPALHNFFELKKETWGVTKNNRGVINEF